MLPYSPWLSPPPSTCVLPQDEFSANEPWIPTSPGGADTRSCSPSGPRAHSPQTWPPDPFFHSLSSPEPPELIQRTGLERGGSSGPGAGTQSIQSCGRKNSYFQTGLIFLVFSPSTVYSGQGVFFRFQKSSKSGVGQLVGSAGTRKAVSSPTP